jgi:hypothetical protein
MAVKLNTTNWIKFLTAGRILLSTMMNSLDLLHHLTSGQQHKRGRSVQLTYSPPSWQGWQGFRYSWKYCCDYFTSAPLPGTGFQENLTVFTECQYVLHVIRNYRHTKHTCASMRQVKKEKPEAEPWFRERPTYQQLSNSKLVHTKCNWIPPLTNL